MAENPTKHEAIEAVRSRAFTTDDGRTVIHTMSSMFGADWDIGAAEGFLSDADVIVWSPHLVGHDLLVKSRDRVIRFDVPSPADDR